MATASVSTARALRALGLLGVLLLAPGAAASDDPIWYPDLGPAQALAAEQGKDLLVDFTGSDWCKWCIQLHREVFSRGSFQEYAREHFVLVSLDFPDKRGEVIRAMSEELQQRNWAHKERYGIDGFPTVLLMSAEGDVWGRTGYRKGGAEAYVAHLEELRGEREQVLASYRGLSDPDPARRLDAAYALMPVARGELAQRILATIREHDTQDSRLVLAQQALLSYVGENLSGEADWSRAWAALQALPDDTPSVRRLAEFHAYRAIVMAHIDEDEDDIDAAVREAERLGLADDTRSWLVSQLELAGHTVGG